MVPTDSLPRVLFVCGGTIVYGFERVILRYIRGLYRIGFPIQCTISGWNDGTFPREIEAIGVPYEAIKLGWVYWRKPAWTLDTVKQFPSAIVAFRRVLSTFRPEIVIHSGYRSLASLAWLTRDRNVVAVQDYWTKPWEHRLVRLLDPRVRAYLACSDDICRHLCSIGLPREKIVRIYNPMRFTERPNEAVHRGGPVVFGIAGQIIERKGHHLVFDAMAKVCKQLPRSSFRLKIYGNGDESYIARLKSQSISLGVHDLVEWCGYCDNSDEYYQGIDCALVMTTTPDPCPLAAIEPGAYSIPAITSTSGGLAELVLDGKTGFLVPPNDAGALADRMVTMISDDENRRRMGVCAFWENKRRFDEPTVIDQVAAILTDVARDLKSQSAKVF